MDERTFDLDQIRAIIALAAEGDLAELTVESGGVKVTVKRAGAAPVPLAAPPRADMRSAPSPEEAETMAAFEGGLPGERQVPTAGMGNHYEPITAPMVGTFYRASNPEAAPFVDEGDAVEPGQTVCIIEAMKLFNEIQAEVRGRIVRILAENGSPVEYGQPLFLIEPSHDGS